MGFFSPIFDTIMNSYYSMSTLPPQPNAGDYYSLPRQKYASASINPPPPSSFVSGTPVILNVFAPVGTPNSNYCTLQSVHYGTLPMKRSNSIKAAKPTNSYGQEKATPGLDQIMKWVKEKRAKYKAGRRSSASAATTSSNASTLKEPPPGILRNSRRKYANYMNSLPRNQQAQQFHQQPQQPQRSFVPTMSLPPTNRQWSTLRRTSDAYYGYDPVYDEDDRVFHSTPKHSFDSYRDYYPTGTFDKLDRYEPSLPRSSRRSSVETAPMLHRYPPSYIEPPVDYSCSSGSSTMESPDLPSPAATKVRFQFPKPEDVQYIETAKDEEEEHYSPSTLQKFEKIYHKFKPNFNNKKATAKKSNSIDSTEDCPSTSSTSGQLENDDTDSTTSIATVHLPTKIVIEDEEEEIKSEEDKEERIGMEGCNNVFFFGETRIDYQCHRVGNNMVVHYTSRKVASKDGKVAPKIQRRGVITDIEYGPGIVQKLREKFSKMASSVIETAQISPHAKQKKFPSVDDILSENEQRSIAKKQREFNDQSQNEHSPKPYYYFHHENEKQQPKSTYPELPSSPPLPSRSQSQPPQKSPPLPMEKPKEYVHQESPRVVVEKAPLGPISALRAKFEQRSTVITSRTHHFGDARQNVGLRSLSVNTLRQHDGRQEQLPKSQENIVHAYNYHQPNMEKEEEEIVRHVPKVPEKRPTGFLPEAIPQNREQELLKGFGENNKQPQREKYFGAAPKPVRVMDLISPPADPAPKEYNYQNDHRVMPHHQQQLPPPIHSPASSTASSDRSPPPEEPRFIHDDDENEIRKDSFEQQYRTQAIQDDRSNERLAFAAMQRQKMTLTLPIGSASQQKLSQQYPSNEIRVGKPGSTPITGPTKLKLPSDNSGISEMQRLLNKFNAIREQKMHETPTPTPPAVEEERTLPTAIVPPVVQQPKPPSTISYSNPMNVVYPHEKDYQQQPQQQRKWSTEMEEKQFQQKNIISISIDHQQQKQHEQQQYHQGYQQYPDDTPHHHAKQRAAPPPPPPLPPRGGTDQQQMQRKSLTSRWLENKQDSDEEGNNNLQVQEPQQQNLPEIEDQQNQQRTHFGLHSTTNTKPYGDNETIDEQTRLRSLETMSVVKEEPEEETEEVGAVRLLSRKTLEEDSGIVHRSDFLKSNYPYDSSESEEDDHHPNAHLAAYGIHRLGIYEAPNASDGNPVRHSLLNLVAEEDIPELLQAMAEECHFVFDDCDSSNMPTTSGIIHTPAKRMERRKQRNVDRICFEEKPPEVFAYVNETSAYEEGEWSEGFYITYEDYKQMVETSQQETAQQHMDLANWRMLMEQKFAAQDEQIRALTEQQQSSSDNNENQQSNVTVSSMSSMSITKPRDEDLGVTSTFSYSSNTPLINQQCAQPLNLRQTTDRETSAI